MSKTSATDSELMLQFTQHMQEEAFAELVQRHSGVVLGVCSSVLRHRQDAEDAYQETFLTLARRAESVRSHASVAGWLYRVARRVAIRIAQQRSPTEELTDVPSTDECPLDVIARRELTVVVAEEIANLPAKYRDTLVLCHLQGLSRHRAAGQLECTEDSLKSRLVRARRHLRIRLARRGVAMTLAIGFLTQACQQSVSAELAAVVVHEASSPPPSILDSISVFEGMTNMKMSLITSSSLLFLALVVGFWPVQSRGGDTEIVVSLPGLDDDQSAHHTNVVVFAPIQQGVANDERRMTFGKQKNGAVPDYWKQVTGEGAWEITNDHSFGGDTSVKYSRPNTAPNDASVCVLDPEHVRYSDVYVSVRVRLKGSLPGTGGGVVWQFLDENNFYSALLSSNGTVEVYRTRQGKRNRLAAASSSAKNDSEWSQIRVIHQAGEVTVFVDNSRVLVCRDPSTSKTGKVGVISSTHKLGIDDFQVKTPSKPFKTLVQDGRS